MPERTASRAKITVTQHPNFERLDPVLEAEVAFSEVRVQPDKTFDVPSFRIQVYDDQDRTDFEGDPCSIIRFEVESAHRSGYPDFPHAEIIGFIREMAWADDVTDDGPDPGHRYIPAPLEGWKPGLYKVLIAVQFDDPEEVPDV